MKTFLSLFSAAAIALFATTATAGNHNGDHAKLQKDSKALTVKYGDKANKAVNDAKKAVKDTSHKAKKAGDKVKKQAKDKTK